MGSRLEPVCPNWLVSYTVASNATSVSRTGTLTVGGRTVTVTQGAVPRVTTNKAIYNKGENVVVILYTIRNCRGWTYC